MKAAIAIVAVILLIAWGSWELVSWTFERDAKHAEAYCAELGADRLEYVGDGHYLCLAADGRVLGRS